MITSTRVSVYFLLWSTACASIPTRRAKIYLCHFLPLVQLTGLPSIIRDHLAKMLWNLNLKDGWMMKYLNTYIVASNLLAMELIAV